MEGDYGAGDGIRTRDINLGKVALYQLSYSRVLKRYQPSVSRIVSDLSIHAIVIPKPVLALIVFLGRARIASC